MVVVETLVITTLENTANDLQCIVQGEKVDWGKLRGLMDKKNREIFSLDNIFKTW